MDRITNSELKRFRGTVQDVVPSDILESTIAWITSNLVPEQVFEERELEEWAKENGFIKES